MDSKPTKHHAAAALHCVRCHADLGPEEVYTIGCDLLCESCCLDRRIARPRKTHWQYISSIQTDYLKPGKE